MINKLFIFLKDYKDAFTSIGVLITFIVSFFSLYFSIRNNKAVHYVNSITKSRIEWIQHLRDKVAEFIANTNIYNNAYYKNNFEKSGEHLSKCQQLCSEISLLLNYSDEKDQKIIDLSRTILESFREYYDSIHNCKVDNNGYFVESKRTKQLKKDVEDNIKILTKQVQIYLKAEWNRVKYESQGKIYEKDTQEFDYKELEIKYDNPLYKNKVWKRFFINSMAMIKRITRLPIFILLICCIVIIIIIFFVA